jgi:hypothetical protein
VALYCCEGEYVKKNGPKKSFLGMKDANRRQSASLSNFVLGKLSDKLAGHLPAEKGKHEGKQTKKTAEINGGYPEALK